MISYRYDKYNTGIVNIRMYERYDQTSWLNEALKDTGYSRQIENVRKAMANWIHNLASALLHPDTTEFWGDTKLIGTLTPEQKKEVFNVIENELKFGTNDDANDVIFKFNFDCQNISHIATLIIVESLFSIGMCFVDDIIIHGIGRSTVFDENGYMSKSMYDHMCERKHVYIIDGVALLHLHTESLPISTFRKYNTDYGLTQIYGSSNSAKYILPTFDDLDDRYTKDYESIRVCNISESVGRKPARHRLNYIRKKDLVLEMCKFLKRDVDSNYMLIDTDHFNKWLKDLNEDAGKNPTRLYFITIANSLSSACTSAIRRALKSIGFQLNNNLYFYNSSFRDAFFTLNVHNREQLYENIETLESRVTSTRELFKQFKTKIPG